MPTVPPPSQPIAPPPPPVVSARQAFTAWYLRQSVVARVTLWLLAIIVACMLLAVLHVFGGLAVAIIVLCLLPLAIALLILFWRWFSQRVLWSVRNRLTFSYLLMGLAPVVLFSSLGLLSLYVFAGQYSTTTALADIETANKELTDSTRSLATLDQQPRDPAPPTRRPAAEPLSDVDASVLTNGLWQPLTRSAGEARVAVAGQPPPAWLKPPFSGLIEHEGKLYLCSAQLIQTSHGLVEVLGTRAVDRSSLGGIGENIGVLRVYSHVVDTTGDHAWGNRAGTSLRLHTPRDRRLAEQDADPDVDVDQAPTESPATSSNNQLSLKAGTLPAAKSLLDPPVVFSSPLPIYHWATGAKNSSMIVVFSRPSILYDRLFQTATQSGRIIRIVLISVALLFWVLELFAVLMAILVSRTIIRSVAELYRGTREIDRGNLTHRVRAQRYDQLGDLARSFNGMSASIAGLLIEQREKDKLLNELSIAQEVQRTLFPPSPASTPGLELHAVCIPALTVGGDYYDFIFGAGNAVCLTLGDISGKGMSAALLMAALHSSIRALSFDSSAAGGAQISPAALMETINRSLYRSTQSSRYATLFAACYSADTRELTYSNGGHLPPMVLSGDGQVQRLTEGGPVVGLLPGMSYGEAHLTLHPGDLFIAFTDGVTEPEQDKQEFGEQRLIELILPIRSAPLPAIMTAVLEAVKHWIGDQEQPDDITLLLARQL